MWDRRRLRRRHPRTESGRDRSPGPLSVETGIGPFEPVSNKIVIGEKRDFAA